MSAEADVLKVLNDAMGVLGEYVEGRKAAPTDQLASVLRALDNPTHDTKRGVYQQFLDLLDEVRHELGQRLEPDLPITIEGVGTLQRSTKGLKTAWEGARLTAVVTARAVDECVDRNTGEMLPSAAIAQKIAEEIVACSGINNASHAWRKGELRKRHIDPRKYSEVSGEPRASVRWL